MAKASVLLRKHAKPNAAGHYPIWLRFTDTRRTLYHSLGVYVHKTYWNDVKREVRKGHAHADRINALIARRLSEVEDERLRLLTEREPVTAAALKAAVARAPAATTDAGCFLAYVRGRLDSLEKAGNVDRHKNDRAVFRKLAAFAAGSPEAGIDLEEQALPFERITTAFLRDLHGHLMGSTVGNNAATANKNLKRIGAYYRSAQAEGVTPPGVNPWAGYRSAKEADVDRAKLTAAELADLGALALAKGTTKRTVRDAFLFSVYTAGIRFADMARLRVRDIVSEIDDEGRPRLRLVYTMGKNGKSVTTRLPVPGARLLAPYLTEEGDAPRAGDAFLFPFFNGYDLSTPEAYRSARGSRNAVYNAALKEIAAEAEIKKTLSSHVARHTFAELARRGGLDMYDTSKLLRHATLTQTQTYMARSDNPKHDRLLDGLFPAAEDDE